jgi:hypothetical protein
MVDDSAVNPSHVPELVARTAASLDESFDIATVYAPERTFGRSGLLFFKPEVASLDALGLQEAARYLWQAAEECEVHIRTAHVISGPYALRQRFVQQNYAVIHENALRMPEDDHSDLGRSLSSNASNSSNSGWDWPVLGALRALGPDRSATDLLDLWRAGLNDIRKLAEDCYALPIEAADRGFVLLNGFYPYQLEAYAARHARIIAFTFDTARPFEWLKRVFQGDADPRVAAKGSVRSFLSDLTKRIGAPEIWTSQNGLHMSANTAEGVQELRVFESCFGDALRSRSEESKK